LLADRLTDQEGVAACQVTLTDWDDLARMLLEESTT
jgi:hypothetical protein